ncbi:MAG: LacI family DNA-binding transcriptional regulator [Bacillota bacterium]|nr:LacI family DNA-binding transcriptional regulator [Bacillota bacterium]
MKITIKDVAKKANVSISTVSRVINKSKPVSEDIRERVEEVIKELNYEPNQIARSLVMKKTNLIGVIVPDISSFFIGEVLNAIEQIAKIYNYDIILCNSYAEKEQELKYLNLLMSKQVEGLIFISYKIEKEHKKFIKNVKFPVVLINRFIKELDVISVSINHEKASYDMTKYLIKKGSKSIALLRSGYSDDMFISDQLLGYQKALSEANINYNKNLIYDGIFKIEKAYELVKGMIANDNVPDAIFAMSDDAAIAAINCLLDNGYKIPEEVQVASFHDTKIASLFRPRLTTIKQPIFDIGSMATRMLIKKINDEEGTNEGNIRIMPHELIKRDSSK